MANPTKRELELVGEAEESLKARGEDVATKQHAIRRWARATILSEQQFEIARADPDNVSAVRAHLVASKDAAAHATELGLEKTVAPKGGHGGKREGAGRPKGSHVAGDRVATPETAPHEPAKIRRVK